ncbi:hypothetical protein Dimus_033082 [Dionaea muscipula]
MGESLGAANVVLDVQNGDLDDNNNNISPSPSAASASLMNIPFVQKVLPYVASQILGSILASGSLRLIFNGKENSFAGSSPIGELAGLAIGATILLNVIILGPVSSASMNPARSLGSAILWNRYKGIWIYFAGPISGAICGAWVYNLIRFTDKPLREITKSGSFLKSMRSR